MDQAGDLASPNFRKPGFFTLGGSEAEAGVSVHWSRVILFHGRWLPYRPWLQNGMWHDSELQHVIDDVKDYGSVMALLATMFFEANVDVMLVNGLAKLLSLPNGSQKVNERFAIAAQQKGANRILIMDALDKYEKKGNNFTGLGAIVDDFRLNVAAAAKTPVTKLFGMAPGGLNATGQSDEDNYNASVKQEQAGWLYQNIWRMYQVLFRHRFGSVPPNLKITFNPLTQETKKERSDRLFVDAQRDQIYAGPQGIGAMTPHGIAKELKEHNVYATQETDDVSAIKEADEAATEQQLEQAKQMALAASGKGGAQPPAPGAPAQPPKV
jgi:phage-related protein (TIGR01555 family)